MLMSKSRLEKFLYALYSLDSSDLPTPLSRIEELCKYWVTGEEVPTFKPLSRVEKYLMAILGAYDVNELPNPISRVEVLLYKLATGDDNLDDVKSFLSEHEELLAEIIRNGGAGGNIDIEYVLYTLSTEFNTLYNTAEKPVKSAILKGRTLVNVHPTDYIVAGSNLTFYLSKIIPKTMIKPNTRYFLRLYNTHQSIVSAYFKPCVKNRVDFISSDNKCAVFTTKSEFADSDFGNNKIHFYSSSELTIEDVKDTKVILCEYVDGMENWDIPYFEGMQSVKMPVLTSSGKNLFNVELEQGSINTNNGTLIETMSAIRSKDFIKLSSNETFTISKSNGTQIITVTIYDKNYKFVRALWEQTFTLTGDEMYVKIADVENDLNNQYQIEKGKTPSSYEPHKSNILTTNEEVTLRGIGEVEDELNLLTGEVTERIGRFIEPKECGVEHSAFKPTDSNIIAFAFNVLSSSLKFKSSKLIQSTNVNQPYSWSNTLGVWYVFRFPKADVPTISDFKQWLLDNEVLYTLRVPVIKTVDLSVVDQDGNNTELSTFNDITHVTLSSEGLIPEAELEVATKNKEVLSTLSLEMDDISTTQNDLQETSDAQSENVDATMIATTEIYEDLL